MHHERHLVIGIGNPGRGDDGLGPALAEAIRAEGIAGVEVEIDYQLAIEHAERIAAVDAVWFVDADATPGGPAVVFETLEPDPGLDFTSHLLEPGRVLALTEELYGRRPMAWLVRIAGRDFGMFREGLTSTARSGLEAARTELVARLRATSGAARH